MGLFDRNLLREVDRTLHAVRGSIDAAFVSGTMGPISESELRRLYFKFEETRFDFRRGLNAKTDNDRENVGAIVRLFESIDKLLHDQEFLGPADRIRYRPATNNPKSPNRFLREAAYARQMSVADALNNLQLELRRLPFPARQKPSVDFIEFVSTQMPQRQGVAPLNFKIVDGRLAIAHRRSLIDDDDAATAGKAREKLFADGQRLVEELQRSNCDPRLTKSFEELTHRLADQKDVVALGITCIACQMMGDKFSDELPNAISVMCASQTTATAMYVAQFPEWQRFVEQANAIELRDRDINRIDAAAQDVVAELRANPAATFSEVPEAIEALRKVLRDSPSSYAKKAALAVWSSLRNLVIKVCAYGKEFATKVGEKTADKLAAATAHVIVVALLGVALAGLLRMAPVATSIEGSAWIQQAVQVVKKEIEELSS